MGQFVNFDIAMRDPVFFHGRTELLRACLRFPWKHRAFLGGAQTGKTTFLFQLYRGLLLAKRGDPAHMLPVYFDLHRELPREGDGFLGWLLARLGLTADYISNRDNERCTDDGFVWEAMELADQQRYDVVHKMSRDDFKVRLTSVVSELRKSGVSGVSFLFDNSDGLVEEDWWISDISGLFREIVTSYSLNSQVSFQFTGFRRLRYHRQTGTSPLMQLVSIEKLQPMGEEDVRQLVRKRCGRRRITDSELTSIFSQSGGHPMLTQRLVSALLEASSERPRPTIGELSARVQTKICRFLESCWDGETHGLSEDERGIYQELLVDDTGSARAMAGRSKRTVNQCRNALELLLASNVVISDRVDEYRTGSQIFQEWVREKIGEPATQDGQDTLELEDGLMEGRRFDVARLTDLEDLLDLDFKKLHAFEADLTIAADVGQKFSVQQRIERDVLPSLRRHQDEYGDLLLGLSQRATYPDADAEVLVRETARAVQVVEKRCVAGDHAELLAMVNEIREKLDEPTQSAMAKLKITLPLLPAIASLEIETDASTIMTGVWRKVAGFIRRMLE